MDLQPTICNLCGGKVEYIPNSKIYGKSYGSGWCYHCTECDAFVGTHKPRPKEALGILANEEMKKWKQWCHNQFDILWKGGIICEWTDKGFKKTTVKPKLKRQKAYYELSKLMNIELKNCHFGYFDIKQLKCAYACVKKLREKYL